MRDRVAPFFTGRDEQIKTFESALDAVEHDFKPPYENTKTTIAMITPSFVVERATVTSG